MGVDKEKTNVLKPLSFRALAWAAAVEATVKTVEHAIDVPPSLSSPFSVLAGQAIETARSSYFGAMQFLDNLDVEDLPNDVPEDIRQHLTNAILEDAKCVLDAEYRRWLSATDYALRTNPFGMGPGVSPIHLL